VTTRSNFDPIIRKDTSTRMESILSILKLEEKRNRTNNSYEEISHRGPEASLTREGLVVLEI
jgi:hypothetical protein